MKRLKKTLLAALAVVAAVSMLTACGGGSNNSGEKPAENKNQTETKTDAAKGSGKI